MKKLSNNEAEFKKALLIKKACIERGFSLKKEIHKLAHVKCKVDLKKQKSGERS